MVVMPQQHLSDEPETASSIPATLSRLVMRGGAMHSSPRGTLQAVAVHCERVPVSNMYVCMDAMAVLIYTLSVGMLTCDCTRSSV